MSIAVGVLIALVIAWLVAHIIVFWHNVYLRDRRIELVHGKDAVCVGCPKCNAYDE